MSDQFVTLETTGRVARLRLDRPAHGNLITSTMMRQFADALARAGTSGADILVISAAGPDFSLGRDQHEVLPAGMSKADNTRLIVEANDGLNGFAGITVSSVRGRAIGFGCGVALQSDFTVVADTAVLGFDEIRHGLTPSFVMGYLEAYVGPKRALDLILTGRVLPALEAERLGMVSRVTGNDDLEAATEALVATLLTSSPELLLANKRYLHDIRDVHPDARMKHALDRMLSRA
jgi:enoyl-CoA hydratase/carnithine racemase